MLVSSSSWLIKSMKQPARIGYLTLDIYSLRRPKLSPFHHTCFSHYIAYFHLWTGSTNYKKNYPALFISYVILSACPFLSIILIVYYSRKAHHNNFLYTCAQQRWKRLWEMDRVSFFPLNNFHFSSIENNKYDMITLVHSNGKIISRPM